MSVDPNRAKSIFWAALDGRTPEEWGSYLDKACRGDVELRRRVEALLAAHLGKDRLFDDPQAMLIGGHSGASEPMEAPGTVIGRYRLLEKIGEGGMAVVYMAEQEEPIRRKVALKIIKMGMDTQQVIARFEAERQALAMMDHPCIAKVLDAGSTETGRPYFVMELVQGVSITEYCDQNSLSTKDRLRLFLQVCSAVQHAHTKGIIHRDLKPSNIMVTNHDGQPIPKVIDFGIAKATNQRLTEKTLFTRYAHLIGTPAYMSPEQAELSDTDIDTRSDIYSLGVLLYELLTGTTPFSEEELRKAGYIEMQRMIREQEPVKPSTRIAALGDTSVEVARRRHATPDLLRKTIRGDLDWIVMKSLEKDRVRRYETAHSLAEEIRRHLEHEPVLARGPSVSYRIQKFLRRHRAQVLAAAVMVVVVAATGVILSLWNRDRERLNQAGEFRDKGVLSQAREQYARGDGEEILETIQPILDSTHVGPEARLLRAGILVDNRRFEEAATILNALLDDRREVAGTACSLLARLLLESESLDAEKLRQIDEYRQRAEQLLPETAEAYYLRAMTADTIQAQIGALNRALELDPEHFESRRLRAFTYYASRKYERMNEDALIMETLHHRDPLGYSLRATALRELGRYEEALKEYDRAMARMSQEDPQYPDLATQRVDTLLCRSDYERAVAEAQRYLGLWPDQTVFRHYLFGALTALGHYDRAADVFREIVRSRPAARQEFRSWCAKYVFGSLQAKRSWRPPGPEPTGAAFLPLVEAQETYCELAAEGHPVLRDAFNAQWSPDGKELALSLGVYDRSGIAVYTPATQEMNLLIVPGKYPKWSPDGQYIAFVRDREFLRVPEFVAADPKAQLPARTGKEVWLIKSDGTEPRRLAQGYSPSWSRDSARVYYHSVLDNALYCVPVVRSGAEPQRIMAWSGCATSVSPDNRQAAYFCLEDLSVKVHDLVSQTTTAKWPSAMLFGRWSPPTWSPRGDELCLGGGGALEDRTGLWIYRFAHREPAQILAGQITDGSWAPDGTKLAFELGAPHFEIWTADIDPKLSAVEALGPSRTIDEHLRHWVEFDTCRIAADPAEAENYLRRAEHYGCLREGVKMRADLRRHDAILERGFSAGPGFGRPWTLAWSVETPFGYQLVVFVERQEDLMHVLRLAFGQKGRCEMKSLDIPMLVTSFLGLCLFGGLDASTAQANFVFDTPVNLGPTINVPGGSCAPCLSADGLELYFQHGEPGDMCVARRETRESEWGAPVDFGPTVNTPGAYEGGASISADGLSLYFGSSSQGLLVMKRTTINDDWGTPVSLGISGYGVSVSADERELYFGNTSGADGAWDVWVTRRASVNDNWGTPVNLGPTINTSSQDNWPGISPDGLVLFFGSDRPGGYGSWDLYMARRATTDDPWGPPVNLGAVLNTTTWETGPKISFDGSTLYWHSPRPGGCSLYDIWQASLIPVVDFNGDGKVDAADMAILVADWGKSSSPCDIGPFPWGDGIVDEKDLKVLMEHLMVPGPKASDVPCDVVLSWVGPSLADSFDVYVGTSLDDVSNATRKDPCGVLVSEGQMETTCNPEGLLDFSRGYYWRVDVVVGASEPVIYKGSVLSFATEPFARPIEHIVATASSSQAGTNPQKTVDGSGLDENDGHSTEMKDMWQSAATPRPHWIQYGFDKTYTLHELWVWNSNQVIESILGFGAKTVKIEYSTDGATWTSLADVPEFARAPGQVGYLHGTVVSFGGIQAKYVKLTIESNWGGVSPSTGLSEVRFFYVPDRSAYNP